MNRELLIITGLSGAGKSQALKILEDIGFFCVDNLPVALLPKFVDLCIISGKRLKRVAVGIDIRAGKDSLESLLNILLDIKKRNITCRIIFMTADDSTLIQRFSETRHVHPLGRRIQDAIKKERLLMSKLFEISDKKIDTSHLTIGELKQLIGSTLGISFNKKIGISIISFGYKYGIPIDADLVWDVRFLPNPNYIAGLRNLNGRDNKVKNYVNKNIKTQEFYNILFNMIEFLIPNFVQEGKSYVTIAIGCTGGKHRSVVVAEQIGNFLRTKNIPARVYHRDIER